MPLGNECCCHRTIQHLTSHPHSLVDASEGAGWGTPPVAAATLSNHTHAITGIYSTVGTITGRLVTCSADCTCKVWDVPTRRLLLSIVCPAMLTAVAMDRLEQRLYMGCVDGRIFEVRRTVWRAVGRAVWCALTVVLLPTGGHARRGGSSHSRTGPRREHW